MTGLGRREEADRPLSHRFLPAMSLSAFVCTVAFWRWLLGRKSSSCVNLLCVVGAPLLVFPTVLAGRRLVDARPTPERVARVTAGVHAVLMILFGVGIIRAVQTSDGWRGFVVPVPRAVGRFLVRLTGFAALLTVLNLALRGLGAPFAVALSRRLATDWLYARTRNPMVLATLACLLAAGLWLQSALFIVWVVALVTPAWLFFVKMYEERELEIRFGDAYRGYREATPFLWPSLRRRPAARPDV